MKAYLWSILICVSLFITCCTESDVPVEKEIPQLSINKDSFLVAQLNISTENEKLVDSRDVYINCSFVVKSDNKDWNYSGTGRIRGRGNSTWLWYPKKPYRIKLDEKAQILGLKADKDWVLLANYRDPTQMMNTFAFTVGRGLNLPYTNHTRYVEVTLNNDYLGLYLLTEQIEQGNSRVAIDSKEGILLVLDADDGPELNPNAEDNFWSTVFHMPVCVKSPEIISPEQLEVIRKNFAELEKSINDADYDLVEKLFDIQSFIDYMIIQELLYNVEVDAPRSIYIHKEKDGRWVMGPLWDFDAGFDFDWSTMYTGHNYFANYKELVLGSDPYHHTQGYGVPAFFTNMFRNRRFVSEYKFRWLAVKDKIMSEYWQTTESYIESASSALVRNDVRWPINKNYKSETINMRRWLLNRVDYLSNVIANYPAGTK